MNVDANKVCGSCLARLRKKAGLTQVELARLLSVPQSYISKVETGERAMRIYEMFGYAQALGIASSELACEVEKDLEAHGLLGSRD